MSDDATRRRTQPRNDATAGQAQPGEYPPPNFPTVFADGVQSLINSPAIVKFFLARFEPTFVGDGRSQLQSFAQVIMPIDGFAMTAVFFEAQLRLLIQNGYITETRVAELRAIFSSGEQS
jgi:hypothetical protein